MINIEQYLIKKNILWKSDTNSKYHPLLTSGLHSNVYINCAKLFENPNTLQMLLRNYEYDYLFDGIISGSLCGLQTDGMIFAYTLPFIFPSLSNLQLIHTSKNNNHRITRWSVQDNDVCFPINLIDDVISTGSSIKKCISNYNVDLFNNIILCIINRSPFESFVLNGKKFIIRSLLRVDTMYWSSEDCLLCQHGSIPIKPKQCWNKCCDT